MKKVDANFHAEVLCTCPHCDWEIDVLRIDAIREAIGDDNRAEACDIEVQCSECRNEFIVENIHF